MAWQTPKTDWVAADGVRNTDINRIEGNILELYNETARAQRIIYVSTSGNDTTGNGTSGSPYRTIAKALSVVPKKLDGYAVSIHIASGSYNEDVMIAGFSGGTLRLTGASANVSVAKLTVDGCIVNCTSLPLTITSAVGLIVTNGGVFATTGNVTATGASTAVNINYGGVVHITGSLVSSASTAVNCSSNAVLYADTISGAGTLSASTGGVIAFNTSTLSRTTASGGRINTGSQGSGGGLSPSSVE